MTVIFPWLSLLQVKNQKYLYESLYSRVSATIPEVGVNVHWADAFFPYCLISPPLPQLLFLQQPIPPPFLQP